RHHPLSRIAPSAIERAVSSDFRFRQVPMPEIPVKASATYRRQAERNVVFAPGSGIMLRLRVRRSA
ncbi:hypothetical protein, partial [Bradyrhizobium elkanii]|uniref:hypothetical protein n=1 Tax=Bradyrhizobium elkanii TaxID=29448 RepID=UPI001AEC0849